MDGTRRVQIHAVATLYFTASAVFVVAAAIVWMATVLDVRATETMQKRGGEIAAILSIVAAVLSGATCALCIERDALSDGRKTMHANSTSRRRSQQIDFT